MSATLESSLDEQVFELQHALSRAIAKRDGSLKDPEVYRRWDDLVRKLARRLDELKTPAWF